MNWTCLAGAGASIWLAIVLLPWRPWGTREFLDTVASSPEEDLSDITVLIPARNEAKLIETTLSRLKLQGLHLSIILIDDQSTDSTTRIARKLADPNLHIITGEPLPPGWSGKLWALEQGSHHVTTPLTLLIDADIELRPGILTVLRMKMKEDGLQFISLMAALQMVSFWERLLMPAFIFFFKLLYPFRLSNSKFVKVAAAAGGCILLETRLIEEIGSFKALRGELIDDCALAKKVKLLGCKIWIGLTHSVCSLRSYDHLSGIWNMVARTAFSQLRYSVLLLLLCTTIMMTAFWLPFVGLLFPTAIAKFISAAALCGMVLIYLPTLKFYGLSSGWGVAMPLIGTLFLGMTWASAVRFWQGKGSRWKGRSYTKIQGSR
jgi:hopene-associated glycosyltransferase HpnB